MWAGFRSSGSPVCLSCTRIDLAVLAVIVQVQRWLGHHSAAFTLATYVYLLDGDLSEPLAIPQTLYNDAK